MWRNVFKIQYTKNQYRILAFLKAFVFLLYSLVILRVGLASIKALDTQSRAWPSLKTRNRHLLGLGSNVTGSLTYNGKKIATKHLTPILSVFM